MKESVFAAEMKQSLNFLYPDALYIKIPDSYMAERFTPVKFFDAFFYIDGQLFVFEYKQHKTPTAFPFNSVRDIQEETLIKAARNGAKAYIVINLRYGKGKYRHDDALFIRIENWVSLRQESSRKSVPLDQLRVCSSCSYHYEEGKKIWDLTSIINPPLTGCTGTS